MKWFIDGAHAIHPNMDRHTGGALTLGQGVPVSGSLKQKLNTHSSTKTELVAVDDSMPMVLWRNYFLAAQN